MTPLKVLAIIALVESGGDPYAVGDLHLGREHARGLYQIRPIVVRDVNRFAGTNYKISDCYDAGKSLQIAQLYLEHYCGTNATAEEYARVWNGGPRGMLSARTKRYWKEVKYLMEVHHVQ